METQTYTEMETEQPYGSRGTYDKVTAGVPVTTIINGLDEKAWQDARHAFLLMMLRRRKYFSASDVKEIDYDGENRGFWVTAACLPGVEKTRKHFMALPLVLE